MEKIIDILKREKELLGDVLSLAKEQRDVLAQKRGGADASKIAGRLETALGRFLATENEQVTFLKEKNSKTIDEWLSAQKSSAKREEAEKLLQEIKMVLRDLERITAASKMLLKKNMEFAGFTINVLNGVAADVTYAPEGDGKPEPLRGRKMFDQSI